MADIAEMVRQLAEQVRELERRLDSPAFGQEIEDPEDF